MISSVWKNQIFTNFDKHWDQQKRLPLDFDKYKDKMDKKHLKKDKILLKSIEEI